MAVAAAWPAATAWIQPLDQELPYDTGAAIRKKKNCNSFTDLSAFTVCSSACMRGTDHERIEGFIVQV